VDKVDTGPSIGRDLGPTNSTLVELLQMIQTCSAKAQRRGDSFEVVFLGDSSAQLLIPLPSSIEGFAGKGKRMSYFVIHNRDSLELSVMSTIAAPCGKIEK